MMQKTLSVDLSVSKNGEFTIEVSEGESGCYVSLGPYTWDDEEFATQKIGNEIMSWVSLMTDEVEECEDDE